MEMMIGCNFIDNCDVHASCSYNHTEGGFRCHCNEERVSDIMLCTRSLGSKRTNNSCASKQVEILYFRGLKVMVAYVNLLFHAPKILTCAMRMQNVYQ